MRESRGPSRSISLTLNAEKWSHFSAFVLWGTVIAILFLGFGLRLYGLDSKGFWGDEIFQVRQSLRPLDALLTRGQTPEIYDDFALHFVILHFVGELGTSEFWMRVPSVGYSLLAMAATLILGTRLFGRGAGVIALLLMALAPFQIWYAQETRMYAAHTFFSALSFYFLLRLQGRAAPGPLAGLVIVNTLGFYNHLFMVFPLMVEGLVGAAIILGAIARRERDLRGEMILGGVAATLVLSLPLILGFLPYLGLQVSESAVDPSSTVRKIDPAFVQDLILFLSMGADWSWRVVLSFSLAALGGAWLLRRDWKMIWIVLVLVLPLAVLYIVTPAGNIAHRYLIFMQPLYLALIAGGVWLAASMAVSLYARGNSARVRSSALIVGTLGLMLLAVVVVPPLSALYARAKLNDWRAVTTFIRRTAGTNDLVLVERAPWAVRAFRWYSPDERAQFATVDELEQARANARPVWYISFGGYFDSASDAWAREHLAPIADSQWQQPDLSYTTNDVFKFPQSESQTHIRTSDWGE